MDMRLARLQNDNKIRNFPRTVSDNDIFSYAGRKRDLNQSPHRYRFVSAGGSNNNNNINNNNNKHGNANQKSTTMLRKGSESKILLGGKNGKQSPRSVKHGKQSLQSTVICSQESPTIHSSPGRDENKNDVEDSNSDRFVTNKAFETETNDMITKVIGAERRSEQSKKEDKDDKSANNKSNTQSPKRASVSPRTDPKMDVHSENNISDVNDKELENLPDVRYPTKRPSYAKMRTGNCGFHTPNSDSDCDNSLCDVKDEEIQHLPDLGTPSRVMSAKSNQTIGCVNSYSNPHEKNNTPERMIINKNKKLHQLKRSISSIESDEDFTSFFGSIRKNRDKRTNKEDIDEEDDDEPFYFSAYISVISSHPEQGLKINRAYSAESFMQRRDCDEVRNNVYSQMSRKGSYLLGDDTRKDESNSPASRLQMRRGALAQPEKMLISQELRERAQKDVEKRKTFMRRVSQFFNLHLRLNREEDLI